MEAPVTDSDSFWKEALDRYFELCLAFFFPQAHADIDWRRGYEMLDKELQQIVRPAKLGRRYVDKLVKVWLKSGAERWLLIHIEVQAQRERDFPKRMYIYNYRIFDRYEREVISLAILADEDPTWRPSHYGYSRWGFRTRMEFPTIQLLDYAANEPALEADPNPFTVVVLAHLKTLQTRQAPAQRQVWKVRLIKGLYERGLDAEDIRQLFRLIDWIMELPKPLDKLFWQEVTQYQEEKRMPFITTPERIGLEKGLLEGIEVSLKIKFGAAGLELMPEIRELQDHEVLRTVLQAIETAANPDALRRVWTRGRRSKKGGQT
jgi:hypothetical protein